MIFSLPKKNPESNPTPPPYYTAQCRDCEALNALLSLRIESLAPDEILQRNHWLGGRYENIHVALDTLPDLRVVLDLAVAHAAHILNRPKRDLSLGWWLNIMRRGEITYPHTHDAGDEWLSGVYYIQAPPGSGVLRLNFGNDRHVEVAPRAGEFVYFSPEVVHEVSRHAAELSRISVGFNVGPSAQNNPVAAGTPV